MQATPHQCKRLMELHPLVFESANKPFGMRNKNRVSNKYGQVEATMDALSPLQLILLLVNTRL